MSNLNIVIEQINNKVVRNNMFIKENFNSNNHWVNGQPEDYAEKLDMTQTKHWVDQFHSAYGVINIDDCDVKWIKEAANVGMHTQEVSRLHKEDLMEAYDKYGERAGHLLNGTKYFVRTDTVSLKEGIHGTGPYTDIKSIFESMITCRSGHSPAEEYTQNIKLYLLPWIDNLEFHKEFRVFVNNNKITAISQQHLYTQNKILATLNTDEEREELCHKWTNIINDYHQKVLVKKITHLDSYVMDIAIIGNQPYFIEINVFGKEYASGSSLFHWLKDESKLYGEEDTIYFRYSI